MIVHPEPASESSDSVAELVADTTRSGDRAAQRAAIEHTYVLAEQLLSEVGWLSPDEVAAAVAAVRADTEARAEAAMAGRTTIGCDQVRAILKGSS